MSGDRPEMHYRNKFLVEGEEDGWSGKGAVKFRGETG